MSVLVKALSKNIKHNIVLNNVSIEILNGQVVGLEGINGSGKTMLMRVICGLVSADSGEVIVDGQRIGIDCDVPKSVGMLIENPAFLPNLTGRENLKLLSTLRNRATLEDIDTALTRVGLDCSDTRKFRSYSLGMKQRLGIAAAIFEQPSLLILDEPTNGLDTSGVEKVIQIIEEERLHGASVLVASHEHDILCDISQVIYRMSDGVITDVENIS